MIEKKLNQEQKKSEVLLDAVDEVKMITNGDAMDDIHLITNAFPKSANSFSLEKNAENTNIKKLADDYGSGVYTREQVKKICLNYRLRFLPSTYYKGSMPIEVIHTLKEFIKKKGLTHLEKTNSSLYERNLYVMAPSAMFDIDSNTQKVKREHDKLRELKRLRALDPALFIRLEEDKFLFVKEWGNSFSFPRRILGMLTARLKTLNRLFFLAWVATLYVGIKGLLYVNSLFPYITIGDNKVLSVVNILALVAYCVALLIILISWMLSGENGFVLTKYKAYRKSFWKIDKEYATENNWNKS